MTEARWVRLTTAPDLYTAEMWVALLRDEGIAAMVMPSDAVSFLGVSALGCRIQVPADAVAAARAVLTDVGAVFN